MSRFPHVVTLPPIYYTMPAYPIPLIIEIVQISRVSVYSGINYNKQLYREMKIRKLIIIKDIVKKLHLNYSYCILHSFNTVGMAITVVTSS